MDITFTLQDGFSGTQADNFNISGVTSSGTITLLASGVTKTQLTNGHTIDVDPTITGGTITSTGLCTNSVNWLTFGVEVTPTPTPSEYVQYTGSGYGDSVQGACDDASLANSGIGRTLYSDCASFEFGQGCNVYSNNSGNALVGYTHVFINGANWDISSVSGIITGLSSVQC
jgi:hypothetical protein